MSDMSFSSNAVIAKCRTIYGRTLTAEEYAQLASKNTVEEVAAYLKQTERYGKALSNANIQTLHRGQLEMILKSIVFETYEGFHRFDFTESSMLYKYIVMQYELIQVLAAIEGIASGYKIDFIANLPRFLISHSKVDLTALARADTFLDIENALQGTVYSKVLRQLLVAAQSTGSININECERRLYNLYYLTWLKGIDKSYKGKHRQELRRCVLKSIDMRNVVTCCRMRRFSKGDPSAVKEMMLPFKFRLRQEHIDRLIQITDIPQLQSELEKLGYRIDSAAEFSTVEQLTESISFAYFKRCIRMSQCSAVVYYSLAECLDTELNNIKTIIEGIRYGISSSDILDMLVI